MHLHNDWLPPAVSLKAAELEPKRFSALVQALEDNWKAKDQDVKATYKFVSVINSFLTTKTEFASSDVERVARIALEIVLYSGGDLFGQIRWGALLSRVLSKYRDELLPTFVIPWRPLYERLLTVHLRRRQAYEGIALHQIHESTLLSVVQRARRYFAVGAAAEIWAELKPAFSDLAHNDALEAAGLVSLFLPVTEGRQLTEDAKEVAFSGSKEPPWSEWVEEWLQLWAAIPHCRFWDGQWASLIARCIKHAPAVCIDWRPFLPVLFTHYLNYFEVPVGKSVASSPVQRGAPRELVRMFSNSSIPKAIAKSVVLLLGRDASVRGQFEAVIDYLEQYYHPSNGGQWTQSLERLLRYLVFYFLKRLAAETRGERVEKSGGPLAVDERRAFVLSLMRLVERAQYSKSGAMVGTAASAAAGLAYAEPALVLPLTIKRFQMALETVTATHQLESAVTTLALCARSILLASKPTSETYSSDPMDLDADPSASDAATLAAGRTALADAMLCTLPGIDANDPPKTLATLQFYVSVLSSVGVVGEVAEGGSGVLPIDWGEWVADFLGRVVALLQHLEPNPETAGHTFTFLMQGGSMYRPVLELLFGRLTPPLYEHALGKLARFLSSSVLPGATSEVGVLCCAAVYAHPEKAVPVLVVPLAEKVLQLLEGSPKTGASGGVAGGLLSLPKKHVPLSPALETSVAYNLDVLCTAVMFAAEPIAAHQALLVKVLAAGFDAPSAKVFESTARVLQCLLGSLLHYYPLNEFAVLAPLPDTGGVEAWLATKGRASPLQRGSPAAPLWHEASSSEVAFANKLVDLHLLGALRDLQSVIKEDTDTAGAANGGSPAVDKDRLRVILQRLDGTLRGLRGCLRDFQSAPRGEFGEEGPLVVVGAVGALVGSESLRDEVAQVLHQAAEYMARARADDASNMQLLLKVIDATTNYGTQEYSGWQLGRHSWQADAHSLTEPRYSTLPGGEDAAARRRPQWLLVEKVFLHLAWRASQAGYRPFSRSMHQPAPPPSAALLANDLLKFALSTYKPVRSAAAGPLEKLLKRYPPLIEACLPTLSAALSTPGGKEEAAIGACAVFSTRMVMRRITQDWEAMSLFITAMLGSAHQESVKAQANISEAFMVFALRFSLPWVELLKTQEGRKKLGGPSYSALLQQIHTMLAGKGAQSSVHWRYMLMGNAILLLLTTTGRGNGSERSRAGPSELAAVKEPAAEHFLRNLASELPPLRPLSAVALLMLLQDETNATPEERSKLTSDAMDVSSGAVQAAGADWLASLREKLAAVVSSDGFTSTAVQNLALDHHLQDGASGGGGGGGSQARGSRMLTEGGAALVRAMGTSAAAREWPHTKHRDAATRAVSGQGFSTTHARLFQRLVLLCGAPVLTALRAPLVAAVEAVAERSSQCVAAEAVAGLLSAGTPAVQEAWADWLRPLFRQALSQALPESLGDWAAAIRFAASGEGSSGQLAPPLRAELLACVAEPVALSAASGQVAKRLTLLGAGLAEVTGARGEAEVAFKAALLKELQPMMAYPARQVREQVGRLLSILCAIRPEAEGTSPPGSPQWESFKQEAAGLCSSIVAGAGEAVSKVQAYTGTQKAGGENGGELGTEAESSEEQAVKWMETVLYFVMSAVKAGDAVFLAPTLAGLLLPLLGMQEAPDQDFSMLAKQALAYLKYLPLPAKALPAAVKSLLAAAAAANWHTRAAALVFIQTFSYRHTFLLQAADLAALRESVLQLLSDPQLEVRELAAATLSGLMKGADKKFGASVRQRFTEAIQVAQASAKGAKKSAKKGGSSVESLESIPVRHGSVLGLSACILSSPYDVPAWLPQLLMVLAGSAHEPPPIKTTVTKTFGEFRRTHADTWTLHRNEFTEEQLEVLNDLTLSPSYFV